MASTKASKAPKPEVVRQKLVKKVNFAYIHRLSSAVALLGFFVTVAAGLMAETRVITTVWRSFLVILAVGIITKVVIRILASYEEINSGKA